MKVLNTVEDMRSFRTSRASGESIGFVPTMGALHDGHLQLVLQARQEQPVVVVSIYINSAQFAPGEDLAQYPVTHQHDLMQLEQLGVDIVFMPSEKEAYPASHATWCEAAAGCASRNAAAEGASRPTFFRGVATVLCKLLTLVRPHALYAGQKDAQQCAVMRALGHAFWPRMIVVIVPTVRASDGLALSSRNAYLSSSDRAYAPVLFLALQRALKLFRAGERDPSAIRDNLHAFFTTENPPPNGIASQLLYVSVCSKHTMQELDSIIPEPSAGETLVCLAAKIGKARLIDNCELTLFPL